MGGLFGIGKKPKPVAMPEVPPPPPIPEVSGEVEDIARRKRPRGRQETFITGELVPETTKKRLLG